MFENFLASLHGLSWAIFCLLCFLALVFFGWFVGVGVQMSWHLYRVRSVLRGLPRDEAPNSEQLSAVFAGDAGLAHLWQEYRKTLYAKARHADDGQWLYQWVATTPAEAVWNLDLVVEPRLRADFFKHLPGLLTGLGIIGTFSGLIQGLSRFQPTADADQTGKQLEPLLAAVSEAFGLSALAIGLAMLVTLIEKVMLSWLAWLVEGIAADLDQRFHPTMAEELLQATVDHTEEAATQLKHLKGELLQDLRPLLQEISDQHRQTLIQMAGLMQQRLEQSTREQIDASGRHSDALGSSIADAIRGSLAGPLEGIREAVHKATTDQSGAAIQMLQDVMVSFSQRLNDLFGGQIAGINELNQRTAESMQQAVTQLAALVASLEEAGRRSGQDMAEQMGRALAEMAQRQAEMATQTQILMAELKAVLLQGRETSEDGLRKAADEMSRRMAEAVERMEQRQAEMNERMRVFVEQIKVLIEGTQSETQRQLQATLATLGTELERLLASLGTGVGNVIARGQEGERDRQQHTQAAVDGLVRGVEALVQQMGEVSSHMRDSVDALQGATSTAVQRLGDGAQQVHAATSEFRAASGQVSTAMGGAAQMAERLGGASQGITGAVASLQQGVQDYQSHRDVVAQMVNQLRAMVETARRDAGTSETLVQRIEAAARALGDAQLQSQEFLDGVAEVLAKSHQSFSVAMQKTVGDNNHQFHKHLSSAVQLLSTSVGELDNTLAGLTLKGRSS